MSRRHRSARIRERTLLAVFAERLREIATAAEPRTGFHAELRTSLVAQAVARDKPPY